ncbi:MAG: protein kinase [Phycisphaeraceae bacterium]|nr:protein kinase [Phycisphaeraceae bacterium]
MNLKNNREKSPHLGLRSGQRLGKYQLVRLLGTGGSCEVWKARDSVESIEVALKIPLVGINGKRDNMQLFREIRLVSQLRHPNILRTKNADVIDGHLVLATEVSMGTLDDRSRPMAPRRFFPLMIQVLDGLAHAHAHKVVHCDVSPMNIFLLPQGRAALGDFGISQKIQGRMATVDDFGTPGYVAPEQAYGRPTYSSDCFAVGLIFYEYLTGVLPKWPFVWPFKGEQRLRDKTSQPLVKFIKRALTLDPAKRYGHAHEMLCSFMEAIPQRLRVSPLITPINGTRPDWVKIRREAFLRKYGQNLNTCHLCKHCKNPISESMQACPWCGASDNHFDFTTQFDYVCGRCHKGMLSQWSYCPWCYGPGYAPFDSTPVTGLRLYGQCERCRSKLLRFMRYCPCCQKKIPQPWPLRFLPEVCHHCSNPVDSHFWRFCPWCEKQLSQ